jgi:3-(3-hydroxy-phenyl)propionate hydroxylase
VHGRIAFVGDAAHLLPIFGVRGANTGFQDAQNLAWKLGMTLRGGAGPALMASYSAERVAAAREIIDEAGKSTRFMTPPSKGFRLLRDAVLSLSLTHEFVRPLYHWRTSRPHDYLDSPLNADDDDSAAFSAGAPCGAPIPNVKLADGDYLLDHLSARFTLIMREDADDVAPLPTLRLPRHAAERLGLQSRTAALLVRPDQHVCARWTTLSAPRLQAALARATARETAPC